MIGSEILQSALKLPQDKRAEIANALIDSLDLEAKYDVELIAEAERREQAVQEGSSTYLSEHEFRQGIGR